MAGTVAAGRRRCSTAPTETVVPVLPRGRGAPRRGMRFDKWRRSRENWVIGMDRFHRILLRRFLCVPPAIQNPGLRRFCTRAAGDNEGLACTVTLARDFK